GIRDKLVTGVQTCALPIFSIEPNDPGGPDAAPRYIWDGDDNGQVWAAKIAQSYGVRRFYADAWSAPSYMKTNGDENNGGMVKPRSEERRVGKECRRRGGGG